MYRCAAKRNTESALMIERRDRDMKKAGMILEGGGQRGIAGGAALQALQVCQQLGDAHNFALRHGDIAIHIAQGTGGRTGHVGAIRPVGKRDAEAGMAGGTGLPVELGVRGHVQAGQIN